MNAVAYALLAFEKVNFGNKDIYIVVVFKDGLEYCLMYYSIIYFCYTMLFILQYKL